MSDPVLDIKNLSVGYATETGVSLAVDQFDLAIAPGEFVGLAGESGCGKSTVAMAALRLLRPPGAILDGTITLAGRDVTSASPAELRELRWRDASIVLQNSLTALDPVKRIESQINEVLRRARPGEAASRSVGELLEMVGIEASRARAYPHELSGGMRQRVAIAMSLALRPKLIVMDEPTTALDVVVQRDILDLVDLLRAELGFAILFITHDLPLLLDTADRIAVMYAGATVESGPARAFHDHQAHPYSKALVSSVPRIETLDAKLVGLKGSPPPVIEAVPGCRFHPRCPIAVERCSTDVPELKEVEPGRLAACLLLEKGEAR